jgi:hypothetical protein
MVAVTLYTVPGTPRPGYESTCPQARPTTSSQNGGVYHPNLLRLPPEEHGMAPHLGHQIGASSPISQALLVPPQPHLVAAFLHAEVSLAVAASSVHPTGVH